MRFNFNDTVLRYPDMEGGDGGGTEFDGNEPADSGNIDTGDSVDTGQPEEPQKPLSVREQIKKSWAEASEPEKPKKAQSGRFGDRKAPQQESQVQAAPPQPALPVPERLSKEAKAEWAKAPRVVQEAFIKAEQDMQKGVDELKGRYALIDKALAPHSDAMRQMNASPGEAVDRMFLWFKALSQNPVASFPGLAQSMGMDWGKIVQAVQGSQQGQQQPQGQQQQPNQQGAPQIPEGLRNYVTGLEDQVRELGNMVRQVQSGFGTIQNDMNAANEAKTRENLSIWSKGKEHFEEVRQDMARLIQADPSLTPNGQVDLDKAYERAIYYNEGVRAKVLAAQQQANQAVQQQAQEAATTAQANQVAKARRAAVSLPASSAPTGTALKPPAKKTGRQTVRDSILSAIQEARESQA